MSRGAVNGGDDDEQFVRRPRRLERGSALSVHVTGGGGGVYVVLSDDPFSFFDRSIGAIHFRGASSNDTFFVCCAPFIYAGCIPPWQVLMYCK